MGSWVDMMSNGPRGPHEASKKLVCCTAYGQESNIILSIIVLLAVNVFGRSSSTFWPILGGNSCTDASAYALCVCPDRRMLPACEDGSERSLGSV